MQQNVRQFVGFKLAFANLNFMCSRDVGGHKSRHIVENYIHKILNIHTLSLNCLRSL